MSELEYAPPSCPSSAIWVILFFIFLAVAIGLAIWLIVLYATKRVNNPNSSNPTIILENPKIVANAAAITGSWGNLTESTDIVTLYVSEHPFRFNPDGTVIVDQTVTKSQSATGSNNSVNIVVGGSQTRNAMLIVSRKGTSVVRMYGPVRVYTQTDATIQNYLFNIVDLDTGNGAVSRTGTFVSQTVPGNTMGSIAGTNDYGVFRLGSSINKNPSSLSFLVNYQLPNDPNDISNPVSILCQNPTNSQVSLAVWTNSTDAINTPIICPQNMAGGCPGANIPISFCQWSYNTSPVSAAGQNKWCLNSTQPLLSGAVAQTVCLAHDGQALNMQPLATSNTWMNLLTGTYVPQTSL